MCTLSYPASKARAPYYIVICDLSGCTIFFCINSKRAQLLEKKVTECKICFDFSLHIFYAISLILRIIKQDMATNLHRPSCKVPVIRIGYRRNLNFVKSFSKKFSNIKFHVHANSGSRALSCGQTDMPKSSQTRLKTARLTFCKKQGTNITGCFLFR